MRFARRLTSLRTTMALLCGLAVLLLVNIVVPQASVLGEKRYGELIEDRPLVSFALETLGLGHMATSPVFLVVLGLFFTNLVAVLLSRLGPTIRRTRIKPRAEAGLRAWAETADALRAPRPPSWSLASAADVLMGFGYRVKRVGERTLWGVKHRTAPLGFLLFHVSFLLLFAGGTMLYYTRFVGRTVLTEGQTHEGAYPDVVRLPATGRIPSVSFTVEEVEARLEAGQPVHLGASFVFADGASSGVREARVNDPARWGPLSVLVQRAGLTPVLWLQDGAGYTVDRVASPATQDVAGTWIPLGEGDLTVFVLPVDVSAGFPSREQLPDTELAFEVYRDGERVWDGSLRPGQSAALDDGRRLVLEEIRYWVGVLAVSERGGGVLVLGFSMAVVGLVWRLLLQRREIVVAWDDEALRVVGHGEYFQQRFRTELEEIMTMLQSPPDPVGSADDDTEVST